jgi:beta-glucosidase-like glycosyl hydrolase
VLSLVNIQRSPLGGRCFESYTEDPFLSGTLAASYVNGLQGDGVGAVIKHFVANDQEDERMAVNSEVDERTLRGELRLDLTMQGERAIFTDAIPVGKSLEKKYT